MWSDKFFYYNIRSDKFYSKSLPTVDIVKILENTKGLKKVGQREFVNDDDFPWINMTCVKSENGNFAYYKKDWSEVTNLITVLASKQDASNENRYVELLRRIANDLNWELILEQDDNGNEDIVLS